MVSARGNRTPTAVREWTRRLALSVVLITCIGGAAFVLVGRPRGDCAVVADMMGTYVDFQNQTAPRARSGPDTVEDAVAVADAQAATARRLQRLAGEIELPALRARAGDFADALAQAARTERERADRPDELDPFEAILPQVDPGQLANDDMLFSSAHVLLTACPSAPRPYGLS
jgi:hypothetical protein